MKFYNVILVVLVYLFNTSTINAQIDSVNLTPTVKLLDEKYKCNTIDEAITQFKLGNFNKSIGNKIYHEMGEDDYTWLHFKPSTLKGTYYFTYWYHYIDYAQLYSLSNGKVTELKQIGRANNSFAFENINFRLPTWQINLENDETEFFLQLKHDSSFVSIVVLYQTLNEFLQFTEIDSYINSFFVTLFLVLIIIVVIIFISEKRFGLLWYGMAICFFIIDYLTYKGLGMKYLWTENPFLTYNIRIIAQALLIICLCMFFIEFYKLKKTKLSIYSFFRGFVYINILMLCGFIVAYSCNCMYDIKYIFIPILRLEALFITLVHILLMLKKRIPIYLGIAFLLPAIFSLVRIYYNPNYSSSITIYFILENMVYIGLSIELISVCFYVINEIVKEKQFASILREENLLLKTNFQDQVLTIQEDERNKLLANVHDSFGGYLEALKLRLLHRAENTPEKVQEILDAFYREYRNLLDNLYSPKINSNNFLSNIEEYIGKMNKLHNNIINSNIKVDTFALSQSNCLHLYRIISEGLTNALKYSKAREILVNIENKEDETMEVIIQDDGQGFDSAKSKYSTFGLKNIEKRVEKMKGNLVINSDKGEGTFIKIVIPIEL